MVRCAMSGQGLRLAAFHPNNGLQRCAFGPTGTMLAICCPSVSQPHPDQAGHPDKVVLENIGRSSQLSCEIEQRAQSASSVQTLLSLQKRSLDSR